MKILGNMKKECLENLTLTRPIEGKRNNGKLLHKFEGMDGRTRTRSDVKGSNLPRAIKERNFWLAMIVNVMKGIWHIKDEVFSVCPY